MLAASKIYNEKQKLNTSYYRVSTVGKQSARRRKGDSSRQKSAQFESRRKTKQEQVSPVESIFDNLGSTSQEKQEKLLSVEELHSLLENFRHQRNFYKSKYEQAVQNIIELSKGEISASQIKLNHYQSANNPIESIKELEEIGLEKSPINNKKETNNDEPIASQQENQDNSKHDEAKRTRNSRIENLIESHANKTYKMIINHPVSSNYLNSERVAEFNVLLEYGNQDINRNINNELLEVGVLKASKNATWGSGFMEGIWVKFLALPARPSSLLLDCAYTAHVWAWSFNVEIPTYAQRRK